ncbi:hypothetical protein [Pyrinomonas methylaliphatogenes]|uniref:PEGA domain-containing protein n=1 Tax=Pyrinomonas methylaliphatogenes TaxID=454194 RepID=A0A0B6WWN9_9BACT|nr:hypothetical protein [Pyrinomonas methylaliphatogenes]MBX5478619.1 hypothetical protein [Pyrinomonas methylaliphatogenes]CDM65708.1 PEGA domain-containing protein [Pyrinomonas methylaliphatogenes]
MRNRSVFFAFVLALFAAFCSTGIAQVKKSGRLDFGRIELSTAPGGYPLLVDDRPVGETTSAVRYIDLPPGKHKLEIQFPNGVRWVREFDVIAGRRQCIKLNYNPRVVRIPRSPCPYAVSVSAPNIVNDGDLITFTANTTYAGDKSLNYTWTISPASARIISGMGSSTVTVDSTGLGQQRVIAMLMVDDGSGDPRCRQQASVATKVFKQTPPSVVAQRFDEFPSISYDDDKARLDNFAIELQNAPGARGFIIVYAGRTSRPGEADRLAARARNYLIGVRGLEAHRIVTVNGGYRERNGYELWIVPTGATPPQPTPDKPLQANR